jgi:RAQPRD family integrative conjugative element protein
MRIQYNGSGFGFIMAILFIGLTSPSTHALESETEKRYLISITTEIDNLKALAQKAAATADEQEHLQFDYSSLLRDLTIMQTAIEQHVKAPSRTPRNLSALSADYTHRVADE